MAVDNAAFWRLRETDLSELKGSGWDDYYAAMTPWLDCADAEIRACAVERLSMAVLWAEKPSDDQTILRRVQWLTATLADAHRQHADVIPTFLRELRFQGHNDPVAAPLLEWLRTLRSMPLSGVDPDVVEGTEVLLDAVQEGDSPQAMQRWQTLLNAPSNYVRGCAAYCLGNCYVTGDAAAALFAAIEASELARPGVAGPFWSPQHGNSEDAPVAPVDWMMMLLEQRNGPAPDDMPFNDIEFYLHELCDHSPATVERMLKGGYVSLALQTATETRGVVEGMAAAFTALGRARQCPGREKCLESPRPLLPLPASACAGGMHSFLAAMGGRSRCLCLSEGGCTGGNLVHRVLSSGRPR